MDYTGIAVLAVFGGLVVFGVVFGVWAFFKRLRVRKLWRSFARGSKDARYRGGIISHPRLEFDVDDLKVLLILATYWEAPDRVVVNATLSCLPGDFALGKLRVAHGVGRLLAGQAEGHVLPLDEVAKGWKVRAGDDGLARRCAGDNLLQAELRSLVRFDPHACVEWGMIKYSTTDYPADEAGLLALIDIALGVATPLRRICNAKDDVETPAWPEAAADVSADRESITVAVHTDSGVSHVTIPRSTALVGRSPSCDLVIDDPTVSREHCVLMTPKDWGSTGERPPPIHWWVRDRSSANGTFLNERKLTSFDVLWFTENDEVRVGSVRLRLGRVVGTPRARVPGSDEPTLIIRTADATPPELSAGTPAAVPGPDRDRALKLISLLRDATTVEARMVGFVGRPSQTHAAFGELRTCGGAACGELLSVVLSGRPAGRLYAAALLVVHDPPAGRAALEWLATDPSPVFFMSADIGHTGTVASTAEALLRSGGLGALYH